MSASIERLAESCSHWTQILETMGDNINKAIKHKLSSAAPILDKSLVHAQACRASVQPAIEIFAKMTESLKAESLAQKGVSSATSK